MSCWPAMLLTYIAPLEVKVRDLDHDTLEVTRPFDLSSQD
jgi:hypothetical protein